MLHPKVVGSETQEQEKENFEPVFMVDRNGRSYWSGKPEPQKIVNPQEEIEETYEDDEGIELSEKEFIFLIDLSGSMYGQPIKLAVQALKVFLLSLPVGSYFNVVAYGTSY
jgi:hypothetical protein